jgi:predicted membrane channel-forming protein YqfA (hemolysin III family)
MTGRGLHRSGTLLLSLLMAVIGVALIVEAIVGVGGATSTLLVAGVLFLAAGLGRLYVERKRGSRA